MFTRAGARDHSPKFSLPSTQILASARENSRCWTRICIYTYVALGFVWIMWNLYVATVSWFRFVDVLQVSSFTETKWYSRHTIHKYRLGKTKHIILCKYLGFLYVLCDKQCISFLADTIVYVKQYINWVFKFKFEKKNSEINKKTMIPQLVIIFIYR